MNRIEQEQKRKQEVKTRKELEQKELESDIKKKAEACRKFINDKRHKEYKDYWLGVIDILRANRDNLSSSVKSNDDYIRQGIRIETQINTLQWVLSEPDKFIDFESKLKTEDK